MRELIVDGYNVIHAWPRLKRVMREHGLEDARHALIHMLAEYGARSGAKVTVVFDAHGRRDDGTKPAIVDGVTVRYGTRGASADHVIERLANQAARRDGALDVVVATSDRLQRDIVGGMGVPTMSARVLLADVARVVEETATHRPHEGTAPARTRRVEDQLPADVLRRLERLRQNVPPADS